MFWVYIAALLVIVVLKGLRDLPGYWDWRTAPGWTPRYNLQLFDTIKLYIRDYSHPVHFANIWGNILPFVPLGLLMPLAFDVFRGFFRTTGMGILLIIAMECLQFISGLGSFDVDDLLLNTLSCTFGYILFKLFTLPQRRNTKH